MQVAEGIFDVLAVFNETNEFVLYYHRFPDIKYILDTICKQRTEDDQSLQEEGWKVDCQLQSAGALFPPILLFLTLYLG